MAVTKNRPVVRGRNWAFVIYADHLERIGGYEKLKGELLALHVPCIISPCHDSDVYDEDTINAWVERHRGTDGKLSSEDEKRKPNAGNVEPAHYHVMLCYKGNKTYITVLDKLNELLGIWYIVRVEDKAAMMRYFCHLDQPDKHPYNVEDACTLNGLDRTPLYELAAIDKSVCLMDICAYVRDNRCVYFCDLVDGLIASNDLTTLGVLIEKCSFVNLYQSSYAQKLGTNMVE